MTPVAQASVLVAFPVAAAVVGSVGAIVRRPGPRLMSAVQHFAAGVVLAALVGEVLPALKDDGHLGVAVTGFVLGTVVVLALGAWGRSRDAAAVTSGAAAVALPVGLLAAVAIDLVVDGMLVGLGATLGSSAGLVLTIALTVEVLFLGLSLAGELTDTGVGKQRAILLCSGLALMTAVGAVGGAALLGGAGDATLAGFLAFGAAALLYLAVEELLVEAHEQTESTLLTAMFFLGFIVIYVLGALGG